MRYVPLHTNNTYIHTYIHTCIHTYTYEPLLRNFKEVHTEHLYFIFSLRVSHANQPTNQPINQLHGAEYSLQSLNW
jgi:hypothetical protein